MAQLTSREVVDRFAHALSTKNLDEAISVLSEDLVEDYPQSGERIVGRDNWVALLTAWPMSDQITTTVNRVVGSEDQWVMGPVWRMTKIVGTGDQFWASGTIDYPDGSQWHLVQLIQLRDGKISRMTSYFAEPFPAADWRKPYVQLASEAPAGAKA